MKSTLAVKPDPPAIDVVAEYATRSTAWHAINSKKKSLRGEIERRRLACSFNGDIPERCAELAASIADLIIASNRSPLRAASEIEALEFDLASLQSAHTAAREKYLIARGALAAEIALTFRERHMAATQGIVSAVDTLSLALQMEHDVRADFAAASPEPTSCLLPDIASDLRSMDLRRWNSVASIWARRIRNLGVSA